MPEYIPDFLMSKQDCCAAFVPVKQICCSRYRFEDHHLSRLERPGRHDHRDQVLSVGDLTARARPSSSKSGCCPMCPLSTASAWRLPAAPCSGATAAASSAPARVSGARRARARASSSPMKRAARPAHPRSRCPALRGRFDLRSTPASSRTATCASARARALARRASARSRTWRFVSASPSQPRDYEHFATRHGMSIALTG